MKQLIIPGVLFLVFSVMNLSAQWVQVAVMDGPVLSIASGAGADSGEDIIYVGLDYDEGVWRSTDGGTTWTETALFNKTILSLLVYGIYVFAGTDEDGIYFTSNNGTTWTQTSLINRTVRTLTSSGIYLFAGTDDYGVYCSANNGVTWFQTSLNNRSVYSLAPSGSSLFAGTLNYGIYKSTNYSTTWTQTPLNNLHIVSIAVNGNNVYAGARSNPFGAYFSTNFGASWNNILANIMVNVLLLNGASLIVGTDGGLYLTTDNGATWAQKNDGFAGNPDVQTLRIVGNEIISGVVYHRLDVGDNRIYKRPLNEIIGIQQVSSEVPADYKLSQNYPNPFNPSTKIRFEIPLSRGVDSEGGRGVFTQITVYDISGKLVETLVNENLAPGIYEVEWSATGGASKYSNGAYFYKLISGNYVETRKMVLIK